MHCFYHAGTPGQGQCPVCHKVLCAQCMQVTSRTGLCAECAVAGNRAYEREVIKTLVYSVLAAVFGFLLARWGGAYLLFAIFWGRQLLRDYFSNALNGWLLPLKIWIFAYVTKFIVYLVVGMLTAPVAVVLTVLRLRRNRQHTVLINEHQASLAV